MLLQLYLTGAVYSLDGSDSLKDTMQTSITAAEKVTARCLKSESHAVKDLLSDFILSTCACVTELRRGRRASPASRGHSPQDFGWSPRPSGAAGSRPGKLTAEQRSQGDPDRGQAAQRCQIDLLCWGAGAAKVTRSLSAASHSLVSSKN